MSVRNQARAEDVFCFLVDILSQVPVEHPVAVGIELIPSPTGSAAAPTEHVLSGWAFTTPIGDRSGPQVQLAFRPLECDDIVCALAGFVAPAHWHGFGIVAPGRAHSVETETQCEPVDVVNRGHRSGYGEPDTFSVTLSVLVDRTNTVRSVIRDGFGNRINVPIRQSGRVLDTCQRVLGLPTAAESTSVATWVTLAWLDAVLSETLDADLGEPPTWAHLSKIESFDFASLGDESHRSWTAARQACADGSLVAWPVSADAAAWMDDAMFSRETVQAYPPLIDTFRDLRSLLVPATFDLLVERISNELSR